MRLLLVALVLAQSSCGWLFHKPRPDADLPPAERPWRVRCNWLARSGEPGKGPETGWVWADDAEARRLVVGGGLEDGFLRADTLRAASDEDDRDVVSLDATAATATEACAGAVARARADEPGTAVVSSVVAAREGEDVEVTLAFPADPAAPRPVSRFVVFGDSLSDPGNLKRRLLVFPANPYWLGRFADGPIWTDHLTKETGIAVQNHSFGGAVSAQHDDVPAADIVSAIQQGAQHFLTGSVQRYVRDYVERDLPAGVVVRPRETVFVIWAGANDYISKEPFTGDIRTLLDTPGGRAGSDEVIALSTTALADLVRRLYAAGARRFVVLNLPNLGRTPAVWLNTSYQPDVRASDEGRRIRLGKRLSDLTARHNEQLARKLREAGREMSGETIMLVDTGEAVERMLAGRAPDGSRRRFDYGFDLPPLERTLRVRRQVLTLQDRCYTGGYLGSSDPEKVCPEVARAFFWDSVHPTSRTHCWITYFVARALAREGLLERVPSPEEHRAYCDAQGDGR